MSKKWVMEDWMREVLGSCEDGEFTTRNIDAEMGVPSWKRDPAFMRIKSILIDLRAAGLLLTPGEKQDIDGALSEVAVVYCELTGGRFSKANTKARFILDEVDICNRKLIEHELTRLRAENERFRNLLHQSVIAIESFDELGRELKGCMPDEIRAALGADDD